MPHGSLNVPEKAFHGQNQEGLGVRDEVASVDFFPLGLWCSHMQHFPFLTQPRFLVPRPLDTLDTLWGRGLGIG